MVHLRSRALRYQDESRDHDSIYIGNNFSEDLLPAALALAKGYCSEKNIRTVVLDATPSPRLLESPQLAALLNDLEVIFLDQEPRARSVLLRLLNYVLALPSAIFLAWKSSREALTDQNQTWFKKQILHAVWDHALQSLPDGLLEISVSRRFWSALKVTESGLHARAVLRKFRPVAAFVGHTVYRGRAVVAEFRRAGVDILAQAAGVFYRLPQNVDTSWSVCSRPEWDLLFSVTEEDNWEAFWSKRSLGESSYEDAQRAAQGRTNDGPGNIPNLILLHIFRDSPFNAIDKTRIFADYVDWVKSSLEILAGSSENWAIKLHPSAERWGENQSTWLEAIEHELLGDYSRLSNVTTYDGSFSNLALLRGAKRVVTFGGTAHLEAACFGVRPIVITEVTLSSFDSTLVCKPRTSDEYKKLLLAPSDSIEFKLAQDEMETARRLLFLREQVMSLQPDLAYLTRYRGDPCALEEESVMRALRQTPAIAPKLFEMGKGLARGIPRSIRFSRYQRWARALGTGRN